MSWNQNASASRHGDQYGQLVKLLHVVVRDAWLGDTGPDGSSSCADLVRVPRWLEQANWLTHFGNRHRAGNDDKTFRLKFQCVHSRRTRTSTATTTASTPASNFWRASSWWPRGRSTMATRKASPTRTGQARWTGTRSDACRAADSSCCEEGDVIVMPAGTHHYVYTIRTKVAHRR